MDKNVFLILNKLNNKTIGLKESKVQTTTSRTINRHSMKLQNSVSVASVIKIMLFILDSTFLIDFILDRMSKGKFNS